jgi:archaeal preflagellin peptidase FlaK
VLFYASWSDYKTREVSNRVWAFYAPTALALSLAQLLLYAPSQLPIYGLSCGLIIGLAFLLFYVGGFGGADSKALMCIAVALPFTPQTLFTPLLTDSISPISQFIFPLTIFSNGVLFAALSGVYMVLRNVIWHRKNKAKMFPGALAYDSVGKKILVLITGYKVNISKLKEKWHIFPMEDVEENTENGVKRKLVVIPHDEGREKIVDRLSNAVNAEKIGAYVWATPGLPMLIFITAGLIVALTFGDVVWIVIRSFFG